MEAKWNKLKVYAYITLFTATVGFGLLLLLFTLDIRNNRELYKIYDHSETTYNLYLQIGSTDFSFDALSYEAFKLDAMEKTLRTYKHQQEFVVPSLRRINLIVDLILLITLATVLIYYFEKKEQLKEVKDEIKETYKDESRIEED